MAEGKLLCTSCNEDITNDTGRAMFLCPDCGKVMIIRCSKCRKMATKYKCPKCGFTGPN